MTKTTPQTAEQMIKALELSLAPFRFKQKLAVLDAAIAKLEGKR